MFVLSRNNGCVKRCVYYCGFIELTIYSTQPFKFPFHSSMAYNEWLINNQKIWKTTNLKLTFLYSFFASKQSISKHV